MPSTAFSKNKRKPIVLFSVAILGVLGISAIAYLQFSRSTPSSQLVNSQTVAVTTKDIIVQTKANGIVQAIRKTNVSSKENGRVIKLLTDEGVRVQQNQLIARMDDRELQAKVMQDKAALLKSKAALQQKQNGNRSQEVAKAGSEVDKNKSLASETSLQLKLADDRLKRKNFLYKQGAISREDLDKTLNEQQVAKEKFKQATNTLNNAKQDLSVQRSGSRPEEIAQAQAEVSQAVAQLRTSQLKLENSLIRAPFAGVISRKFAQEGDSVSPTTAASSGDGATSSSIVELSSGAEVEAKVPEASTARIQVNQPVEIRSDVYPNRVFRGRVYSIAPKATQDSQNTNSSSGGKSSGGVTSFRVRINLETGQNLLKLGTNVKLNFINNQVKGALVVPLAAVVTEKDGKTGVWIPDAAGKPQYQVVKLGEVNGDRIQIVKGLASRQRIFLSPPTDRIIPGVDKPQGLN
jgi:HlyD family secretion protein